ncbi:AzlD domain-containing protein [Rothia sp. P6271]|uniref:AzlD domain-containing protein n=1 Tax=unclassified Rothia (in: high G+C Gram-positive bacteria) TaxID=2689056 RepID=UPI003AC65AAB
MPNVEYMLLAVAVASAVTFVLRAVPFAVKNALEDSPLIENLSRWIPSGAMILLAIYALYHLDYSSPENVIPYLLGAVVTIVVHLSTQHMVASLVSGTVVCVLLANIVFV